MAETFISPDVLIHEEARPNSDKSNVGAKVRVNIFTTPDITGLVATDIIRLGLLKEGWRLLGMKFTCPANWLAATATISLGVTGAATQYLVAGAVGAAAVTLDAINSTGALLYGVVRAADEELIMTVNTAGAGSAPTGVAKVVVTYVRG